jgi:N-acyl-phosphatidylethanolamine-hydrolysing phospholipase D
MRMVHTVGFSLSYRHLKSQTCFRSLACSWRAYSLLSKPCPGWPLSNTARFKYGIVKNGHLQQRQQIRPYVYLPLTWSDLRERFQRWVERTEQRIVQVSLLNRDRPGEDSSSMSPSKSPLTPMPLLRRRYNPSRKHVHGRNGHFRTWFKRQQQRAMNRISASLPLPSIKDETGPSLSSLGHADLRSRYQGWKIRRKEQYQGWKTRRQEQYQRWKSRRREQYQGWQIRRQAQYQRWNDKKNEVWVRTRKILLEEYSQPEWFDSLGRPLTSRDSTGRFVNPWKSQSTNGIHSVDTILRWRWQRLERELKQVGLIGLVMPTLPWTKSPVSTSPLLNQEVPPLPMPQESEFQFTWVGHATCWLQVERDFTILTDPMFSVRAGPSQILPIGIARDIPPAFTVRELVEHQKRLQSVQASSAGHEEAAILNNDNYGKIDICCITHDHYDHMDKNSVMDLRDYVQLWVVPLGLADWLVEKCSIDNSRIVELEWWQQLRIGKYETDGTVVVLPTADETNELETLYSEGRTLAITCCPSSHWASRTMSDRNLRLWSSFAISTPSFNFFLCGDTGYPEGFPLFRQIGDALGPFDLAAIPIGAYGTSISLLDERTDRLSERSKLIFLRCSFLISVEPTEMMKDAHVDPKEALQIHKDLRSKHSVAIHWGSFQLSEEPMDAPPRDLKHALREEESYSEDHCSIDFSVLDHGCTLTVSRDISLAENYEPDLMATSQ